MTLLRRRDGELRDFEAWTRERTRRWGSASGQCGQYTGRVAPQSRMRLNVGRLREVDGDLW